MNRNDYLGEKVLWVLERNGRMRVDAIAELLNEKPKAVAASCANLHRLGQARPILTGKTIRNRLGQKKPEVNWEIGPAENIPPMPVHHGEKHDIVNDIVGVDDADLEWMERYQQQRMKRQQLSDNDARFLL